MGRIEADIALESWLFGFRPCSGQGQFILLTATYNTHAADMTQSTPKALYYNRHPEIIYIRITIFTNPTQQKQARAAAPPRSPNARAADK